VRIEVGDAAVPQRGQAFDSVLVDPPCSGLGTLQSRPDLRWRVTPKAVVELAALQQRMLAAAARATAPSGILVYSVCTISRTESEKVIDSFLDRSEDFTRDAPDRQLLPHRDGTDGFFIARLRRT
jgi:16S rRNA (cytosine967-C5)-methyltransferase